MSSCCRFLWQWDYTNSKTELVKWVWRALHASTPLVTTMTVVEKAEFLALENVSWERVACTVTRPRAGRPNCVLIPPKRQEILLFPKKIWTDFLTHATFHSTGKGKFLRVNQPGIEADHPPDPVPRIKVIRATGLFLTDIHGAHRKHLVFSLQIKQIVIYAILSVKSKVHFKARVVSPTSYKHKHKKLRYSWT